MGTTGYPGSSVSMTGKGAKITSKTAINAVLTRVSPRDLIYLMKGIEMEPSRPFQPRLAGILLLVGVLAVCGCSKFPGNLFSRGGTDLSLSLTVNQDITYQVEVGSSIPSTTAGAGAVQATLKSRIRTRTGSTKDADGIKVQGDILGGDMVMAGKPAAIQLVGQKISYVISSLRRQSQWTGVGLGIPVGPELFDMGVPKGKIKQGETWKVESDRNLFQLQDSIRITRNFTIRGEEVSGGQACYAVSTTIPAATKKLSSGLKIEVSGKGDTWISKKDGRVMRATEFLQGVIRDDRQGNQAAPFSQNIEVSELSAVSAPSTPVTAAKPAAPAPITPAPSAPGATPAVHTPSPLTQAAPVASPLAVASTPVIQAAVTTPTPVSAAPQAAVATPAPAKTNESAKAAPTPADPRRERIVFVSNSTGKREVWTMAVDGTEKMSLTGYTNAHWSHDFEQEGKLMACTSKRTTGTNLWFVDMEGGAATPLTDFSENDDIVSGWSDGGAKLVFMKKSKLWRVSRDGFNLQSFEIDGPVVSFSATPDTAQVAAVVSVLNQRKIQMVDVNSGTVREMYEGDMPSWSPKGDRLAYRNQETLNISMADGTGTKELYRGRILNAPLIWDPTGAKVACTVQDSENSSPYMMIVGEDGTKTAIGKEDALKRGDLAEDSAQVNQGRYAQAFSPTGNRIAYLSGGNLWIARIDGSVHTQMTSDGATSGPVRWGKYYVR